MKCFISAVFALFLSSAVTIASANDSENAETLTIGGRVSNPIPIDAAISLGGDNISISARLENQNTESIQYGFFAYTQLFQKFGEAETYADKTFSDLRVEVDGKPLALTSDSRAFFLGQDITHALTGAGIAPIPNAGVDDDRLTSVPEQMGVKLKDGSDWEGQVLYSWQTLVPASEAREMTIRYKSLPQFELADISGARFNRLVGQHCGDASMVAKQVRKMKPNLRAVVLQKYVAPVSFFKSASVTLTVGQPTENSLGAHPLLALVCGVTVPNGSFLPIKGVIGESDARISILVISAPAM
ncbi:DUF4424 family protein [Paraburkholderia silviterrae]|uniref:DUF4424 family protein n=1 Tax=Paraburkholderia silviterrae TaxID=2528715 RepID=UPI001F0FE9E3|nr:DUF4424 family protein [Paraburkholderia silviterrae]